MKGDFEQFFASRSQNETSFWRARMWAAVAYYNGRERTLMRETRAAKKAAGPDPWTWLEAMERGIEADFHRNPRTRAAAAEVWVAELERLSGVAQAVIAGTA